MPEVPAGGEIYVEAFNDLGRVIPSGFGSVALSFTEIMAGVPWADERDRRLIRKMSEQYLVEYQMGEDPFRIPPLDRSTKH